MAFIDSQTLYEAVLRDAYVNLDPGAAPSVAPDGLSLRHVSVNGGETLEIRGTNLLGATVTIGGVAAPVVGQVTSDCVQVRVPPGPPGLADVRIDGPGG